MPHSDSILEHTLYPYTTLVGSEMGLKWRLTHRYALEFNYRFDVDFNRDIDIDYKKDKVTIKAVEITPQRNFNNVIGVIYTFDWRKN